jgi:NTP pyrophosphatase (non-canonical NTP hydrolase)
MDLQAFQESIAATFGAKDRARGVDGTFMYFAAEVGELAEALRDPKKHDLAGEFADCQAWLTSLAVVAGIDLAAVTAAKYPGRCLRCAGSPCACSGKP